jgi:hypothetical protein
MSGYRRAHDGGDDGTFVHLRDARDGTEAQLLRQVLEDHDIPCRVLGTGAASLVGVGQHLMPVRIEVPARLFEQALTVLRALDEAKVEGPWDATDEDEPASQAARSGLAKATMVAGVAVLVVLALAWLLGK